MVRMSFQDSQVVFRLFELGRHWIDASIEFRKSQRIDVLAGLFNTVKVPSSRAEISPLKPLGISGYW